MCGIAGVLDPSGPPEERTLRAMNDCLDHRGPDDAGVYVDGPVALTHRRLSIIDPEGGHQPLFDEDRSVAVVFNGEIYNHRDLRRELADAGHRFSTDADTEVLVHGYEEWDEGLLDRLEGMFAFALWDAESECLLLARDRLGIKPLLVARDGDRVGFASELPVLFEAPLSLGGLDRTAVSQYFGFGFVPAPRTVFANVSKLRPGEKAVVTADGLRRERYYRPTIPARDPGFDAAATELRRLVRGAVSKRLMSDVPLGAFLSGGIDSSVVVGTMADLTDEPVKTFTVGFDETLFDESGPARRVAEYHDTDHHTYMVSPADVREAVPTVLERLGEPFADASLLPTYVVARETSEAVTVALSGDGADELFGGYARYAGEQFSGYYRAVPALVRRRLTEPLVGRLPASRSSPLGEFARKAQKFTRGGEPEPVWRHFDWMRLPVDGATESFTMVDPVADCRARLADEHGAVDALLPSDRQDPLSRMMAVDVGFTLPNQMLHKVDLAGMYNSLEVRTPFLDATVVEYALSLPREYKVRGRTRKRLLNRAFSDVLSESVRERPKRGFDMPIGEWFKGSLRAEFRETVRSVETSFLDSSAVITTFEEHCTGRRDHSKFLWSVYVFLRWLRRMRATGVLPDPSPT